MWLNKLYQRWTGRPTGNRRPLQRWERQRRERLTLEQLEDRLVPSNFTAATAADLIADINAANQQGGANTITLVAPTTSPYLLTSVDNTTDGGNYLPVIAANDNLTIVGNGDTIQGASSSPGRAFDVAAGASLTLQNLTLQSLGFSSGNGGAIYNHGTLDLDTVTVQHCYAGPTVSGGGGAAIYNQGTAVLNNVTLQANSDQGVSGGAIYNQGALSLNGGIVQGNTGGGLVNQGTADLNNVTVQGNNAERGGGILSSGSLTLEGGTKVQNNSATWGGGLFVNGGTATVSNATFSSNTAAGENGQCYWFWTFRGYVRRCTGPVDGRGGAVYVAGGTVTVTNSTLSSNTATVGRNTGNAGLNGLANGLGGAVYVAGGTVEFRNDTVTGNSALRGYGGAGEGGGLYINSLASVCLDAFTLVHVANNTASTAYPDIYGPYTLC